MTEIKFGTDGWRAVIAEDFTFANVERVAQAAADYWKRNPIRGTRQLLVVGFDRRFFSDRFAECVAEVFAGNGFKVVLTAEPTPTPAVSQAVRDHKAVGGVMLTASHNPPAFNGFKVKAWFGGSADPQICRAIEKRLDKSKVKRIDLTEAKKRRLVRVKDVRPAHYQAIKKLVDFDLIAKSKLRFAHEALYGVGAGCFDELLAGTSCQVTTINAEQDPNFGGISPEPVERNYGNSQKLLSKRPHDLCLVTDGDADRVGGMDGRGNYLSQPSCLAALAHWLLHDFGHTSIALVYRPQ